ncbi:class I SAM-dependent DNA methyltransferase [Flavobacterium beibuense]|nr:N-6 DNA methylase [Flavobacterium beibuense]
MAKAWSRTLGADKHLIQAQNFIRQAISIYWQVVHESSLRQKPLPALQYHLTKSKLDNATLAVAGAVGRAAAHLGVIEAAYYLGNIYTAVLPEGIRSGNGVFYTPPGLTQRLIDMATLGGVAWDKARVADPACGGGAFLAPVALKMMEALPDLSNIQFLEHLERHLKGYELDPFAAWLTQVFLEIAVKDRISGAGRRMRNLVTVCDTLEYSFEREEKFDLVIGNPPYGKLKLSEQTKLKYKDSLFGHPNLYGLFTHLALNMVKTNGVVGYLTPTSFLSGEYFKNLRQYILSTATPLEIDFVAVRKGVFDDVLQETMLATYRKAKFKRSKVLVNEITTSIYDESIIERLGDFSLPTKKSEPWILPRSIGQSLSVPAMVKMSNRLSNWGFRISTGQLVWNRHKEQLNDSYKKNAYPVIWSEAVTQDGEFIHRAEKKNHSFWFHYNGEEFLLTTRPCILLQRTTSKEQEKRLNAAVLPQSLLDKRKAVVIENHLNMIFPVTESPPVSLEVVCAFLNSRAVNDAFRTISGSVAVSAYELESLPIPSPSKLKKLTQLVAEKAHKALIEKECYELYTL